MQRFNVQGINKDEKRRYGLTEEYLRELVSQWIESGELDRETAEKLLARILKILFEETDGDGG